MEVLVEALEALGTKVVDLEGKGLAVWEEVGAEGDMGQTLETWVVGAVVDLVDVLFFLFQTSPKSLPM